MQKDLIELFNKTTETSLEAARKIGELNLRTFEMFLQQQATVLGACLELSSKSFDVASKAKGMQELVEGQTQIGREMSERGMEILRKGMTAVNETSAEYAGLVQANVKSAQDQFSAATSKATKKAA